MRVIHIGLAEINIVRGDQRDIVFVSELDQFMFDALFVGSNSAAVMARDFDIEAVGKKPAHIFARQYPRHRLARREANARLRLRCRRTAQSARRYTAPILRRNVRIGAVFFDERHSDERGKIAITLFVLHQQHQLIETRRASLF